VHTESTAYAEVRALIVDTHPDIVALVDTTVERFGELIESESLATSLRPGLTGQGHTWAGELNGVSAQLELEKT